MVAVEQRGLQPPAIGINTDDALLLNLEAWEGPLDILLTLARQQKVDLRQISILDLVEQYLAFVTEVRALKLEVAADYLVMAAWLAYLKSTMLLPKAEEQDPSPDELALRLQLRLQRLDAMREASARLMARDRIGRENFLRFQPEGLRDIRLRRLDGSLFDLIRSYGQLRLRTDPVIHHVARRPVISLDAALANLRTLLDGAADWTRLSAFLPTDVPGDLCRSAVASTFVAALELAKQGAADLKQEDAFAPLFVRQSS